jgi:hypothetical protein
VNATWAWASLMRFQRANLYHFKALSLSLISMMRLKKLKLMQDFTSVSLKRIAKKQSHSSYELEACASWTRCLHKQSVRLSPSSSNTRDKRPSQCLNCQALKTTVDVTNGKCLSVLTRDAHKPSKLHGLQCMKQKEQSRLLLNLRSNNLQSPRSKWFLGQTYLLIQRQQWLTSSSPYKSASVFLCQTYPRHSLPLCISLPVKHTWLTFLKSSKGSKRPLPVVMNSHSLPNSSNTSMLSHSREEGSEMSQSWPTVTKPRHSYSTQQTSVKENLTRW